MLFLHLALALYRDYTTHKIYDGRKSKHVITNGKKNDYNTEEEEKKESGEERQTETGNIVMEQELGK